MAAKKYEPTPILLGIVSFLLTVTLGLISFSISQYEKKSDKMYDLVDTMNTNFQAHLLRAERHELMIQANGENIKVLGNNVKNLESRVYKLEKF